MNNIIFISNYEESYSLTKKKRTHDKHKLYKHISTTSINKQICCSSYILFIISDETIMIFIYVCIIIYLSIMINTSYTIYYISKYVVINYVYIFLFVH